MIHSGTMGQSASDSLWLRMTQHPNDDLSSVGAPRPSKAQNLCHMLVPWDRLDAEGYWRATGETIVLLEVDRLVGKLLHAECPEQVRDSEENLFLSIFDGRANATTGNGVLS